MYIDCIGRRLRLTFIGTFLITHSQLLRHSLPILIIHGYALLRTNRPPFVENYFICLSVHAFTTPCSTFLGPHPPYIFWRIEATELPLRVSIHKTPDGCQCSANPPRRLPRFLVVTADTETDLAIDFKSPGWCQKTKGRRSQRVRWWQDNAAMVDSSGVRRRSWRPSQCEVPIK